MLKRVDVKVCRHDSAFPACRGAAWVDTLSPVVAAKRTGGDTVKTTVELPGELWRAAKIRAMDERADLRSVLIRALEDYLRESGTKRAERAISPSR
jgi:hypothetical protein